MSEKNNPLEGIMDMISQYTKEDANKLDLDFVKDTVSSLLSHDQLKSLLNTGSGGKASLNALGSLGSLGNMANVMSVLPMVEKVVKQRMYKKQSGSHQHEGCKKDKHEENDIKELLEDILDELKKIKKCTCYKKKHGCHKGNWEHWY
ncbi:hypothetical protein JI667_11405 [Bacillus sp. NTK074B]|uniref:hypothetical protein n=1 Tax=Bacillus sp. NTK074B TaxID=2802174 RepID=UPI001A9059FB|nr:hypothetical protein [Bacillus sp. NTK074B]